MKELTSGDLHAISGGSMKPMDAIDFAATYIGMFSSYQIAFVFLPKATPANIIGLVSLNGAFLAAGGFAGYEIGQGIKYLWGDTSSS